MSDDLTTLQVAALLRLTPARVDDLLDLGEIPFSVSAGGDRLVHMGDVVAYAARLEKDSVVRFLDNPTAQLNAIACVLAEDHSLRGQLSQLEPSPGTFGDLLRQAACLSDLGANGASRNVVPLFRRMSTQKGG